MLQNLPRPFSNSSVIAAANTKGCTLFFLKTSSAHFSQLPPHPATNWISSKERLTNVIRGIFSHYKSLEALCIFHVQQISSLRDFSDLPNTNSARSFLPSFFCSLARARSSMSRFMPFFKTISETSKFDRCCLFLELPDVPHAPPDSLVCLDLLRRRTALVEAVVLGDPVAPKSG